MIKKEKLKTKTKTIDLKYDDNEFDITYSKSKDRVIIRRLYDEKVVGKFDAERIGFIVQEPNNYKYKKDPLGNIEDVIEHSSFVISYFDKKEGRNYIGHYLLSDYDDKLWERAKYCVPSLRVKDVRVGKHSYIIDIDGKDSYICNLNTNVLDKLYVDVSRTYTKIYNDKKDRKEIEKILGRKGIMVSEEVKVSPKIKDTLYYVIDPVTFEAVSLIWSTLEQRYIEVKVRKEFTLNRHVQKEIEKENSWRTHRTINEEVIKYLRLLRNYVDETLVDENVEINREFIKKLKVK